MTKNLTPMPLRCPMGDCPSVHQLEDGDLLIVGRRAEPHEANIGADGQSVIGEGEAGVVIARAMLAEI